MNSRTLVITALVAIAVALLALEVGDRFLFGKQHRADSIHPLPELLYEERETAEVVMHDGSSSARHLVASQEDGDPRQLEIPYAKLLESFPSLADIKLMLPNPLPRPPAEGTPYVEDLSDGRKALWAGVLDENGQRNGMWVSWTQEGIVRSIINYESGRIVPPVMGLHKNGTIRSYYPRVDAEGRVQGVGWWWYPDGSPHAALTWQDSVQSGPALFLTPQGLVDKDKTRIYEPPK